jgi:hypothetical protein
MEGPGEIRIIRNNLLQNLAGVPRVQSLERFEVIDNANLQTLEGIQFQGGKISGPLNIQFNRSLTSLAGLESIREAEFYVWIFENDALESLDGLQNLESVTEWLTIENNDVLADCSAVEKLVDIVDHGTPGPATHPGINAGLYWSPDIGANRSISNNTEGCNSVVEIAPLPLVERVMTGSWYDPASSGEGFMIHAASEWQAPVAGVSPGNIGIRIGYFYGYYPDGSRFWLIGTHTGPNDWSEPVEFESYEALNGRFENFDPDEVALHDWGSFVVEMHSCEFATVTLKGRFKNTEDEVEKVLPVQRLGHVAGGLCTQEVADNETDSITGTWYDTAMSGQGFSIHKLTDDWGIVYFYGFDQAREPLWLIGVWTDPLEMGGEIDVPMDVVTGGTWDLVDPDQIVTEHWGTMKLTMDGCQLASAEMEGDDGYQAFNLTQLAGTRDLWCPLEEGE